jgi:hypothetical protein
MIVYIYIYKWLKTTTVFFTWSVNATPSVPFHAPKQPAENAIFEQFIYINDHFAKTGSGQT